MFGLPFSAQIDQSNDDQPPPPCRRLINPVSHTQYSVPASRYTPITARYTLWQSFRIGRTLIHLHGNNNPGVLSVCVCVCERSDLTGEKVTVCWSSSVTGSHSLAGAAGMDLSGDTLIWLIGLIGFQRACRETEPDTDQITAETPGEDPPQTDWAGEEWGGGG